VQGAGQKLLAGGGEVWMLAGLVVDLWSVDSDKVSVRYCRRLLLLLLSVV